MTVFQLNDSVKLGLMSGNEIAKILADKLPHPNKGSGILTCELNLKVENVGEYLERKTN